MEKLAAEAAHQILDSGHLVVAVFVLLVLVLLVSLWAMFRYFSAALERQQDEVRRLTDTVIDIQSRTTAVIKDWTSTIDAFMRGQDGHR